MRLCLSFFAFFLIFFSKLPSSQGSTFEMFNHEPVPNGIHLQQLLSLSSDADDNKYYLHAMIDNNGVPAGLYKKQVINSPDTSEEGHQNVYWLRELESENGGVLMHQKGRNILLLQGQLNRKTWEGKFVLKYLTNGISMSYDECDIYIRRGPKGWLVQDAKGKLVQEAVIETSFLGIRKINGLCQNKERL